MHLSFSTTSLMFLLFLDLIHSNIFPLKRFENNFISTVQTIVLLFGSSSQFDPKLIELLCALSLD